MIDVLKSITPFNLYRKHFYRKQARQVSSIVGDGRSIVDIGSGLGRLAEAMHDAMPNAQIVCTDVENYNRTDLPFVLANGSKLPFADNSFDAATIFYVLHHTDDPQALLREARRVTRGRIIIQEDTYRNPIERFAYTKHIQRFRRDHPTSQITPVRKDEDWQRMFAEEGFALVSRRRIRRFNYPITSVEYQLEASNTPSN